jgi:hypothetical protein
LFLRAAAHNANVRKRRRDAVEKRRLSLLCLEQRHFAVRKCGRERNAGRAAARADVDQRAAVATNGLECDERTLDVLAPRRLVVRDRGQTRSRDERANPVDETLVPNRR